MNSKFIAIAVVAVLAVAGISVAVITMTGNGDKSYKAEREDGRLMIYGNANKDDYLDEGDVETLEKIISGDLKKTQFADANQDGKIDQADIDMVKQMIKREKMTIYYHNTLTNKADKVKYPVKTIVPIVNETDVAMKVLGKTTDFVGIYSAPDTKLFADVPSTVPVFTKTDVISVDALSTLGCDAIITLPSEKYVTNETQINDAGIQVLRFDFRNPDCSPAYLTAGYILGVEERSHKYVEFADNILKEIQDKVKAKYADDKRVKAMVLGMNVIYGNISGYGNMVVGAGGINAVDWYEHKKVSDGYEWLYNYDFDWICGRVSLGGYDYSKDDATENSSISTTWGKHANTYKLTDAYNAGHMMLLNTAIPDLIKAVYMAEQFYPDVFESGYGDKIHQQYVDMFIDNLHAEGYKVTDGEFCITKEDIKA